MIFQWSSSLQCSSMVCPNLLVRRHVLVLSSECYKGAISYIKFMMEIRHIYFDALRFLLLASFPVGGKNIAWGDTGTKCWGGSYGHVESCTIHRVPGSLTISRLQSLRIPWLMRPFCTSVTLVANVTRLDGESSKIPDSRALGTTACWEDSVSISWSSGQNLHR